MNLRLKILQQPGTSNYQVVAILNFQSFENDMKSQYRDDTIGIFSEMFELETLSVNVTEKNNVTEIKIETQNEDKINVLKKNMMKIFRNESGLGNDKIHLN